METIIFIWGVVAILGIIYLAFVYPIIGIPLIVLVIGFFIWAFTYEDRLKRKKEQQKSKESKKIKLNREQITAISVATVFFVGVAIITFAIPDNNDETTSSENMEETRVDTENDYETRVIAEESEESKPVDSPVKTTLNETNDTETVVQGKDGNDWINMTDNQKFHAVSNGLYNLDSNGYTILEGEYYFIDALDSFYDGGDLSASVDRTLASLGLMSGMIIE